AAGGAVADVRRGVGEPLRAAERLPAGAAVNAHALGSEVADEVVRAQAKFDRFTSPHEGWAVIKEELDELWEHVRSNSGRFDGARTEAIQVTAMAIRYVLDLCEEAL